VTLCELIWIETPVARVSGPVTSRRSLGVEGEPRSKASVVCALVVRPPSVSVPMELAPEAPGLMLWAAVPAVTVPTIDPLPARVPAFRVVPPV
jgi:hypothetical protein